MDRSIELWQGYTRTQIVDPRSAVRALDFETTFRTAAPASLAAGVTCLSWAHDWCRTALARQRRAVRSGVTSADLDGASLWHRVLYARNSSEMWDKSMVIGRNYISDGVLEHLWRGDKIFSDFQSGKSVKFCFKTGRKTNASISLRGALWKIYIMISCSCQSMILDCTTAHQQMPGNNILCDSL